MIDIIADTDREIARILQSERRRQEENVELIASENIASDAVMAALGSAFTNKYAEGYPGARYYGGCGPSDEVENVAIDRAKKLFGAGYANVQPHSGSQANQAVFLALLEPGDRILGMALDSGGHLTHGARVNLSGMWFEALHYGVDPSTGRIDYEDVARKANENKPRIIIAGGSAYPLTIDFARFREIADSVGAYLLADIAHYAGLVAAGVYPNPLPHAHIVTTTTHKTLRGPRGGLILTNDATLARKIDKAVFPGLQGGPLMNVVAAKAVAFGEALHPHFRTYSERVLANARAMADTLQRRGLDIVTGTTQSHLVLIDLRRLDLTGADLERALEGCGITCNKNGVPGDTRGPRSTSGIRIGSPAITSRGLGIQQASHIADMIADVATALGTPDEALVLDRTRERRRGLMLDYPVSARPQIKPDHG